MFGFGVAVASGVFVADAVGGTFVGVTAVAVVVGKGNAVDVEAIVEVAVGDGVIGAGAQADADKRNAKAKGKRIFIYYFMDPNSSLEIPNSRMIARTVPGARSLLPQSGATVTLSFAGLCHLRCEPFPPASSTQPKSRRRLARSRYFIRW